ncbi:OmpA family protein [Methylobacterium oryzisoli]|uniref:OmpA family protein n=1 Tax=Methylobacterium oryzisoli TaxID=3385502 RepID=UPI0038929B6C
MRPVRALLLTGTILPALLLQPLPGGRALADPAVGRTEAGRIEMAQAGGPERGGPPERGGGAERGGPDRGAPERGAPGGRGPGAERPEPRERAPERAAPRPEPRERPAERPEPRERAPERAAPAERGEPRPAPRPERGERPDRDERPGSRPEPTAPRQPERPTPPRDGARDRDGSGSGSREERSREERRGPDAPAQRAPDAPRQPAAPAEPARPAPGRPTSPVPPAQTEPGRPTAPPGAPQGGGRSGPSPDRVQPGAPAGTPDRDRRDLDRRDGERRDLDRRDGDPRDLDRRDLDRRDPDRRDQDRRDLDRQGSDRRDLDRRDPDRRDADRRDDRRDLVPGGYRRDEPDYIPGGYRRGDADVRSYEDVRRARREYNEGGRLYIREPGRVIVRDGDRTYIRHDETERFRELDRSARIERRGADTVTIIDRPGGVQIVTVVDEDGRLLRRTRRARDGREVVLIDNTYEGRPRGFARDVVVLPPPDIRIPRERYVVEADRADEGLIYEALTAPPVAPVERRYTLDEVRYSPTLRARMRSVDLDTITFDTGSWLIASDQAKRLSVIAAAIAKAIQRNPQEVFLIEGHTDAVGSDIDNLSLSDRRAQEVAALLTRDFRVPPENLTTQGYGEQALKVNTQDPSRENRRVTVRRITPLIQQEAERR